jgi:hypothetical protein
MAWSVWPQSLVVIGPVALLGNGAPDAGKNIAAGADPSSSELL